MPEIDEIYEFLQTTVRSIGGEITSPWFYFQLGLILAGAGLAHLLAISLRSRVDITSFAMGWPTTFRLAVRVLIRYAAFGFFAALMAITRVIMVASTWPSRSYLLVVAANLAAAWLLIRLATSLIRNDTTVKLVSITAWCIAALSILGPARTDHGRTRFRRHHLRRPPLFAAARAQGRRRSSLSRSGLRTSPAISSMRGSPT